MLLFTCTFHGHETQVTQQQTRVGFTSARIEAKTQGTESESITYSNHTDNTLITWDIYCYVGGIALCRCKYRRVCWNTRLSFISKSVQLYLSVYLFNFFILSTDLSIKAKWFIHQFIDCFLSLFIYLFINLFHYSSIHQFILLMTYLSPYIWICKSNS